MVKEADAFILKNLLQIRDMEEFFSFSMECLKEILSSSELKVKKEEEVLESIVKWVERNGGSESELKQLLKCI